MRLSATPTAGFESASILKIDPKELRVTASGNSVRVEATVLVLGSGLTRVAQLGFALLGEDDRVLHRYAQKGPDETRDRFGFVATVIPAARPRDVRAIRFEDTTEQRFPMELVWEYPVLHSGNGLELGERKQRRSRGLPLRAATATLNERGLDVELELGPPAANRVYDGVNVCVLATTAAGMELERATAALASDRAIATIALSPAQLEQVRTLDIRLEGTIYHDGPTGRFGLHPA